MLVYRHYLVIGFALAAVIAIAWFSQEVMESPGESELVMESQSDFHMRGLNLHVSSEGGDAKYHVFASSLTHFPHNDTMSLQEPKMVIYHQGQPSWVVAAKEGLLKKKEQQLELRHHVSLYEGGADAAPLRLELEHIIVDLVKKQASSEADIALKQHDVGELSGRGLLLDLQNNRLQLQSKVRVRYENF
ncbi:MAG: LPS export ABC transporter periplasmic protein LptC [Gammaproteobacteria bacterium]|nr:LPS export ABC transporter periplasmic protein LptC [Gammaproteobacteria bacterium]MCF6231174.1 LPS export ABC transporter periplasmic protein LptC [Gammaproteobacteria bacterium]